MKWRYPKVHLRVRVKCLLCDRRLWLTEAVCRLSGKHTYYFHPECRDFMKDGLL